MLPTIGFLAALAAILLGAHLFTTGIERVGRAWGLGRSVMGNLLAAVGTALPESLLPVVAFFWGGRDGVEVGVGVILGAPLMLTTLAMALLGLAALLRRTAPSTSRTFAGPAARRPESPPLPPTEPLHIITPDPLTVRRDLQFFLGAAAISLAAASIPLPWMRPLAASALVLIYARYVQLNMRDTVRSARIRSSGAVGGLLQLLAGLAIMVLAAQQFVAFLERMAHQSHLSPFVIATLLAPVATELPEKFASVLWLMRRQDDLAVGNITGALVFQGTLIPAIGMLLTPWTFGPAEYTALGLAVLGGLYVRLLHRPDRGLPAAPLLLNATLYAAYLVIALRLHP